MKLEKKTKVENLFLLLLIGVGGFCVFCLTGCGGNSCETIKCYDETRGSITMKGISVPGAGGIFSPGKGCDSCLWAQSCKVMNVTDQTEEKMEMTACDTVYYGDGCGGCFQKKKSCYSGFISMEGNTNITGFVYGSSDNDEIVIGSVNGQSGCGKSQGLFKTTLDRVEEFQGID